MAARIGLLSLGGGVLVALIVGGLTAIAPDARSFGRSVAQTVSGTINRPVGLVTKASAPAVPTIVPTIAEGRKDLGDSVFAVRSGGQIILSFDTDTLRTRFDWKFEGIVRATLPMMFGPDASAALEAVPSGSLVSGGSLLVELPVRGIPLSLSGGRTLRIWPVTRLGRDGPLIVGYRAAASR